MEKLSEMHNIGAELEKKLLQADINTPQELIAIGSRSAFLRIRAFDNDACLSKLCALEGAIRGVRWHYLPDDVKTELKQFCKLINK
jgi:DNA transformation protein and related proteins